MSRFIQTGTSVGVQFGDATQPESQQQAQDTYGDIGCEAGGLPPPTTYITVGRGKSDLPPGATEVHCKISAPSIRTGYNCD